MSPLVPVPQDLGLDEPEAGSHPESEFNLAEYVGMLRRHWKLAAACCLLGLTGAGIHYAITPKAYQATTTIQIERRNLTPLGNGQNPWLENYWNMEFYPTQYELLQSRGLAERVVKSLDLMEDPTFNPGAGRERGGAAKGGANAAATAEADEAVLGTLADQIRGGLSVEPVRSTQLVQVSFRASSPEFAAKAANAFAEAYIDMGVEDRFATAGKASTFLSSQIETLKQEIQDKETQLQAFSRRSDIVSMDPGSNVTLKRLEGLNGQYIDAKKLRIEREAEYHESINGPKGSMSDTLSSGVVSDQRAQLLKLERDYDTRLKTYKPDFPDMVALKAEIEKTRQHLNQIVGEQVDKVRNNTLAGYQTALRQEQELEGELNTLKRQAIDQNSAAVEYTNLKVEIKTRRDLLDELLRKQSETEVAVRLQDTRQSNIRIIDKALVPGGPFQPSLRKDVSYGLVLGLLFGVSCIVLFEFLDRTVKSPEEIERKLGLPMLAVIQDLSEGGKAYGYAAYGYGGGGSEGDGEKGRGQPAKAAPAAGWLDKKKGSPSGGPPPGQIELVPHERPRTLISESYRSLRTALLLSSARELKVIAVTSAVAGEGKTATASNLAVVLAQLGRQVLIVDCDLRKPRLHQVFRVSNRFGLVNQLTATAEPESVFLATEVPNLWVTPSGPIPPNPSELLASDRMREWLRTLRARFDFVVLDTPPALAVTDATIVGLLADGVVLTLRSGKVTREEARLCRDRLRQAGIKILGAVLNRYRSLQTGLGKKYKYYEAYGAEESEPKKAGKSGSAA
ncbi:MAG TPA: polysaccharide biosynthesis tyrosine autokinase [Solirubrobacterales bacterium]|nr:polysaccharide biosynthesis tyrosine autokinase [Solirubrobacterales bacterium]